MKIALASDHAGLKLKNEIKSHLIEKNYDVQDFGTNNEDSCDYPDYALNVAEKVSKGSFDFGILVCGTGIGMSISANKVPDIRAALCCDTFSAHACRQHNNANILTLGERVVGPGLAFDIVDTFLSSKFEGGRHLNRINKIKDIEKKYNKLKSKDY